jgi:hypothetical protein
MGFVCIPMESVVIDRIVRWEYRLYRVLLQLVNLLIA